MNDLRSERVSNGIVAYPTLAVLLIYIFCYQFKLPLNNFKMNTLFSAGFAALLCLAKNVRMTKQVLLLGVVVIVSALGVLYTDNMAQAKPEMFTNIVGFIMVLALSQDENLLKKLKKATYLCMIAVLVGVMLQYILQDNFSFIMKPFYQPQTYQLFVRRFTENSYAGFSGYPVNAAYYCATLFGCIIFKMLQKTEKDKTEKIVLSVGAILSIFAVMLTSKRGLAVSLAASFAVSYMIWKRVSVKTVIKVVFFAALASGVLYFLIKYNEAVGTFMKRFDAQPGGDVTTGRNEIWRFLFEHISNPIFGQGTGSTYTYAPAAAHNIYLQLYYDHGFFGILPYILFFANGFIEAIKRNDPVSLYAQTVFLVYGMSGNPLYTDTILYVYLIFAVVIVKKPENISGKGKKHESRYINVS